MKRNDNAALIAGTVAGVAGLLVFLVLHALWVLPIWFILPIGLVLAVIGGLAVGWAYAEIQHGLPPRPWTIPAVVALIAVILLPAMVLAEMREPLFALTAMGAVLSVGTSVVVVRFVLELLLTAAVTGYLVGGWVGRTRRAAVATAVAGFVFALGPGHNIPFVGGTAGVGKEIVIMAVVVVVSALVLVEGEARLAATGWVT
jgi:hypothetical protein